MATFTLTIPPSDVPRVQAAAAGLGYSGPQAMITALLKQSVQSYEASTFKPSDLNVTAQ